jgi:hypothetical protein
MLISKKQTYLSGMYDAPQKVKIGKPFSNFAQSHFFAF